MNGHTRYDGQRKISQNVERVGVVSGKSNSRPSANPALHYRYACICCSRQVGTLPKRRRQIRLVHYYHPPCEQSGSEHKAERRVRGFVPIAQCVECDDPNNSLSTHAFAAGGLTSIPRNRTRRAKSKYTAIQPHIAIHATTAGSTSKTDNSKTPHGNPKNC